MSYKNWNFRSNVFFLIVNKTSFDEFKVHDNTSIVKYFIVHVNSFTMRMVLSAHLQLAMLQGIGKNILMNIWAKSWLGILVPCCLEELVDLSSNVAVDFLGQEFSLQRRSALVLTLATF